ncbi:MAG: hypothetical protein JXA37_09260 [Chloroflexia bacterium]|nr:hypothetical protein [Chloroflexia bacterium]
MNKANAKERTKEMPAEYDFSGGVRGKHYRAYGKGYQVLVHKKDGRTEKKDS